MRIQDEQMVVDRYLTIVNTQRTHEMCVRSIERHVNSMQTGGETPSRSSIVCAIFNLFSLNGDLVEKQTGQRFRDLKAEYKVAIAALVTDHLQDYWGGKVAKTKGRSADFVIIDDPLNETTGTENMPDKNTTLLNINPDAVYVKKEFVFGRDIDQMTNDEMIEAIARLEHEVKHLGSIKTKAKGIDAKKAALEQAIERLAERLNA